jgi:hypothetical protein
MEDLESLEASGVHGKSKMSYREVMHANSEAFAAAQVTNYLPDLLSGYDSITHS